MLNPMPTMMTAEELLANPLPHVRSELVQGRLLVREPASWHHGEIAGRILVAISNHLSTERRERGLREARGHVVAAETGFALARNPDTVRAPDVVYVRSERRPSRGHLGFAELAPDLAVEVLSPSDRPGSVLAKVADWLDAGTLLVWIIDPSRRVARIYRADGGESIVAAHESLLGEDVLPDLSIPLADMID